MNPDEKTALPVWYKVHVDAVENLPRSNSGMKYLLIYVCASSGFTQARATRTLNATEITKVTDEVLAGFSICKILMYVCVCIKIQSCWSDQQLLQ